MAVIKQMAQIILHIKRVVAVVEDQLTAMAQVKTMTEVLEPPNVI